MKQSTKLRQDCIRTEAADYLKTWIGTPYFWGGNDFYAFDCSGLVVEVLQAHGILKRGTDYSAQGLRELFKNHRQPEKPYIGCLVFWVNNQNRATHVAMCLNDMFIIHASGGGRFTNTLKGAIQDDAFVKKDFLPAEIERRTGYQVEFLDPFGGEE